MTYIFLTLALNDYEFSLNDVLIMPDISKKLLLVAGFSKENNCSFVFFSWRYEIKDLSTGRVLFRRKIKDNLYPIHFGVKRPPTLVSCCAI